MQNKLADLIGKLQPEEFEDKKDFSFNKGILDNLNKVYAKGVEEYLSSLGNPTYFAQRALAEVYAVSNKDIQTWHDLTYRLYEYPKYPILHAIPLSSHFYTAFLSGLCERATEDSTLRLKSPLRNFAETYKGNKTVTIIGAIDILGTDMQEGTIIVKGPVHLVGSRMCGGILDVCGETIHLGQEMTGGVINVIDTADHSDYPTIIGDNAEGGIIYLNNKPVYPRPE